MTIEEAIRILDPETTGAALEEIEYYAGFSGKKARVHAVSYACELVCKALRETGSIETFRKGAGAMKQDILLAMEKLEKGLTGTQKAALVAARRVIEKMKAPSMPVLIVCEGYQMFRGTMQVSYQGTAQAEDITGDWLYRPDTDCWYCRGRSYPAEICEIVEGV